MRGEGEQPINVRLHPNCGACGSLLEPGDSITVLKHHKNALLKIDAGQFPETKAHPLVGFVDSSQLGRRYQLCRLGHGDVCAGESESVTFHSDCLNLYVKNMRAGDGWRKLWVAATWRYPWVNCTQLRLPPVDNVMRYMDCAKDVLNLPRLVRLPLELQMDILKLSGSALVGRYASVLQLTSELASDQPFVGNLSLDNIHRWNRGARPTISHVITGQEIKVIIDARGLLEIRMVTEPMEDLTVRSDHMLYITGPVEKFSGIRVDFQNGLARLIVPCTRQLTLWDFPATRFRGIIVSADESSFYHAPLAMTFRPPNRFVSIDLRRCDGLTFFMAPSGLYAIHAHTSESPNAVEAFERLRLLYDQPLTWFYLPLAADDEVLSVGLRLRHFDFVDLNPSILIHLRSGHYVIGPNPTGKVFDVLLQTHGRPRLIYQPSSDVELSSQSTQISVSPQTGGRAKYHFIQQGGRRPQGTICHSDAPLNDVRSIAVFRDAIKGTCAGLILTYRDGRQRPVGQCRWGLDVVYTYQNPVRLHHSYRLHPPGEARGGFGVVYVDVGLDELADPGPREYPNDIVETQVWTCSKMEGLLKFWSRAHSSYLQVESPWTAVPGETLEFNLGHLGGQCRMPQLERELLRRHASD
ncbi:unnamed protein product [Clonostachys rosea]|uniref:F-box domain-containing protein n=1 Tax=Bionectria ochroleuca TaxID=29856 RepID=A0ABY6UL94_BIOOC|nr:unnamed protein product [Clonostachys rosea]